MSGECERCGGTKAVVEPMGKGWINCPACNGSAVHGGGFSLSEDETMICAAALILAATDPVFAGAPEVLRDPRNLAKVWALRATAYAWLVNVQGDADSWMELSNRLRGLVEQASMTRAAEAWANQGGPS